MTENPPAATPNPPLWQFAAIVAAAWLLWAGMTGPAMAAPREDAGVISKVSGDTWLIRESFMSSPVRQSAAVRSGDRLVTGSDGRIELRLADDAVIGIGPGSEFRIDDYQFDQTRQRSFFSLARGVMRQVSGQIGKRNHDDYRLRTPTGVLGIRGTEFQAQETTCPPAGCRAGVVPGLAVEVFQGRVAVSSRVGTVEVPAGSAIHLRDALTVPEFTAGPYRRGSLTPRRPLNALPGLAGPRGSGGAVAGRAESPLNDALAAALPVADRLPARPPAGAGVRTAAGAPGPGGRNGTPERRDPDSRQPHLY